ncbi:Histidine kinase [Friedmanniella luteola]|uniref:Histidine kinase n=1 Tax=Friedmanniella luteola TaxID=546871 RepID=A0A1H1TFQ7_9ACTN|nr:histidine kinase [Friedmanniella luteola]SDS59008.1 Histidine kinase [Friedmanniella luteola]
MIGLGAVLVVAAVTEAQALEDSERMTRRLAELVVAPMLPGYLARDPQAVAALDEAVHERMADGVLTDVVVWAADGEIVYSDRPEDVGRHPRRTPPDVAAALGGRVVTTVEADPPGTDGTAPPGVPADQGRPTLYLEVYRPLVVGGLEPLAFEACYDETRVEQLAHRLLRQTLPLVLVPLLLLQLVQVPAAVSLARRLERRGDERARRLERSLDASDRERSRLAAALHDGPVQDLAGVSYVLAAVAPVVPAQHADRVARAQEDLQWALRGLRGLMSDLVPPDLASGTLEEVLDGLGDQLRGEGLDVRLDVPPRGRGGRRDRQRAVPGGLRDGGQRRGARPRGPGRDQRAPRGARPPREERAGAAGGHGRRGGRRPVPLGPALRGAPPAPAARRPRGLARRSAVRGLPGRPGHQRACGDPGGPGGQRPRVVGLTPAGTPPAATAERRLLR